MYCSDDISEMERIIIFLKSHKTDYVSGQELSKLLKISRVAVWKQIKKIKKLGYEIDSKQKLGYKMTNTTTLPLPWEIRNGLKSKILGRKIYYLETVDSTQNFAVEIASEKNHGTVVVSKQQTKGKGRLGRKWASPNGGIWLSVVLQPEIDVTKTTLIPIASSLALVVAIEKSLDIKPKLKWPNDVTVNGKKVAGMLVEASIESNKIEHLILGVGINFKINPKKIEQKLKNTEHFYGVETLVKEDTTESPIKLIQEFLYQLEKNINMLTEGKIRPIITQWTKRSSTIGHKISITTSDGKISGNATHIDDEGALILSKNGHRNRVLVGDVT